jgi:hypothetical protein
MGRLDGKGETMFVYLVRNDKTFVVRVGDMLDEQYKVVSIGDEKLVISHIPSDSAHVISLNAGVPQ